MESNNKIILGGANIGRTYGVQSLSKSNALQSEELTNFAKLLGGVDTAQNYGKSEEEIGKLEGKFAKIFTKISIEDSDNVGSIIDKITASQVKLKRIDINVYIHNAEEIQEIDSTKLNNFFAAIKNKGVLNVGYSVYTYEAYKKLKQKCKPDIVQYPFNALNRILHDQIKDDDVAKFARSVFLQGLLVKQNTYQKFANEQLKIELDRWYSYCRVAKIEPFNAALDHILQFRDELNGVVVGVDTTDELSRIITRFNEKVEKQINFVPKIDSHYTDPRFW